MAEWSGVYTTTTGTLGDAQASYSQTDHATMNRVKAACSGFEGVAPGYLNELKATATGANTVQVATGGAMVDGLAYVNSAAVNVNIPSASGGGNTRIDRIVVRATWAGTDTAITRIAGTDAASPTAPAITQTSGTTYDIQICQVLVDTGGTCTVTDERVYAAPQSNVLALDSRQGGSTGAWGTPGTTNYTGTLNALLKVGAAQKTPNVNDYHAVTFDSPYSAAPVVYACPATTESSYQSAWVQVHSIGTGGFKLTWFEDDGTAVTNSDPSAMWFAFGPK